MAVTVFPTGTTIYDPLKTWSGFTIFSTLAGDARLIDMNGAVVNVWPGIHGFPNKVLPGGYLIGSRGTRSSRYGFQDQIDLVQVDWQNNVVWEFNKHEYISDPEEKPRWMARQHHDFQREGNPVGYFAPGQEPCVNQGNTLILCHKNSRNLQISNKLLLDDAFLEVNWKGQITWSWKTSDHFEELGFSKRAKQVLSRNPNMLNIGEGFGDWMHINSMSRIGSNKWFEAGNALFNPQNIIFSSRQSNILGIVEQKSGKIVWKLGPDYNNRPYSKIGYIIGPHHAHIIPRGLPGEGNLLVFDNGGWAGYGATNPGCRNGVNNALRDTSRVLELDPITLEIVWQYTAGEAGFSMPAYGHRFYSSLVSNAQRLPNGNTLITEGVDGRIFEVTRSYEIVWEYVNPFSNSEYISLVYRSYRVPYDWVPQAGKPEEKAVPRLINRDFRVPVSQNANILGIHQTRPDNGNDSGSQFCVLPTNDAQKLK